MAEETQRGTVASISCEAEMQVKHISTGFNARPLQAVILSKMKRFNVLVMHRRFGKTVLAINHLIDKGLRCEYRNPQLAYIAPTYGQAEKIAWQMLKNYSAMLPGVEYNESKLRCIIPRPHLGDKVTIYLLGAENPDSLRGIYLDEVVFDEYASMHPDIWGKVVRPALADRGGGAVFVGTPSGQNHFYDVYKMAEQNAGKGWFCAIYKASQTGVLPEEEIEAMKLEMSEDEIEQELECSFTAAITGAYWGKQLSQLETGGKFCRVPHDPALLVDTFWDLGVSDTTAIWFVQQFRQEVRIIDYWEGTGSGIPDFAKVLKEGHRSDYSYREHNWPHDGNSRDLSTGKERSVTARGLGIKPLIVHPKYDVADSIDAARRLLPRCVFDLEKCSFQIKGERGTRGIESLKNYTKKWDAKNKIYMDSPLHNWASHGADGFRLLGMALKPGKDRDDRGNLPRKSVNEFNIFDY